MSDDDRARRRMGDATKGRIADLASGWEVPPDAKGAGGVAAGAAPAAPASGTPPGPPESTVSGELPRKKSRTQPPPPPGSSGRTKSPTEPPAFPLPAPPGSSDRVKPPTRPPPLPTRARSDSRPPPKPPHHVGDEGELTVPDSPEAAAGLPAPARLADSGFAQVQKASVGPDPQKGVMRRVVEASTAPGTQMRPSLDFPLTAFKDDGPRGLRGDATIVPTGDDSRGKPARGDPSQVPTTPFEKDGGIAAAGAPRADDTIGAFVASLAASPSTTIRPLVTLPRQRGIVGDVRYVFTAVFGVARARREAVSAAQALTKLAAERRERLISLGRAAVVQERFDHPQMGAAREQLERIEEERSQFAGQVAAADSELDHVKRERGKRAAQVIADIGAREAELVQIKAKLAPLLRDQLIARRRATAIRDQIVRIDARIKATESSLLSVKTAREDRAAVQADVATLKADRVSIQRDEPALAAQLDGVAPKIAALEAGRKDAVAAIAELRETEDADDGRSKDLVAAIEAKRKVVSRSQADAEVARDKALHGLAARLLAARPHELGRAFEPIDELDETIGVRERRATELKELLGSVDKRAIARGVAVMVVIAGAAVAGVVLALI